MVNKQALSANELCLYVIHIEDNFPSLNAIFFGQAKLFELEKIKPIKGYAACQVSFSNDIDNVVIDIGLKEEVTFRTFMPYFNSAAVFHCFDVTRESIAQRRLVNSAIFRSNPCTILGIRKDDIYTFELGDGNKYDATSTFALDTAIVAYSYLINRALARQGPRNLSVRKNLKQIVEGANNSENLGFYENELVRARKELIDDILGI